MRCWVGHIADDPVDGGEGGEFDDRPPHLHPLPVERRQAEGVGGVLLQHVWPHDEVQVTVVCRRRVLVDRDLEEIVQSVRKRIESRIRRRRLALFGHVARMPPGVPALDALWFELEVRCGSAHLIRVGSDPVGA